MGTDIARRFEKASPAVQKMVMDIYKWGDAAKQADTLLVEIAGSAMGFVDGAMAHGASEADAIAAALIRAKSRLEWILTDGETQHG
ncbi:MAG TPA: hypothetical protein VFI41_05215 [Gemmatimonadales bacterium]|nr:hypothetical protein [Gemmatimonadales bacterium]